MSTTTKDKVECIKCKASMDPTPGLWLCDNCADSVGLILNMMQKHRRIWLERFYPDQNTYQIWLITQIIIIKGL
jgi:hypothetical protein